MEEENYQAQTLSSAKFKSLREICKSLSVLGLSPTDRITPKNRQTHVPHPFLYSAPEGYMFCQGQILPVRQRASVTIYPAYPCIPVPPH